jgi:SAM-dependent methyltransferase
LKDKKIDDIISTMKICKICSNETSEIIDKKSTKKYHKCAVCGYIALNESFYVDETRERAHYDKHHNTLESLGYVKMFEDLVCEFVLPYKDSIKTSLDFGCGEGEVLPIVLERENILCDRYDLHYFREKIYKDKEYDLILSTEVFEHLQNPIEAFAELLLHIKKDGYLLLMSAFHPDNDEEFLKWWYIRDITHIGFFNLRTFIYMADRFNLEIVKHNFKNSVLFKKK